MLALSPTLFQTFGWPLDEPTTNEQICFSRENESNNASSTNNLGLTFPNFLHPHPAPGNLELDHSTSFTDYSCGDPNMVKKLNHNASERDRRKKMNGLFSSLRSLLPAADQMKKLSIPATVSRVLKYIPELQKEVEKLQQKKEDILSKIAKQQNHLTYYQTKRERKPQKNSNFSPIISATQLSGTEIMVQISTYSNIIHKIPPLSEILLHLLEGGLLLINSSSFESFEGRVFYNLHLKVEGTHDILEPEAIREKLVSLYEKRNGLFTSVITDHLSV